MSEFANCPDCSCPFDLQSHNPKILQCGHNLCLSCLNAALEDNSVCPLDGLPLQNIYRSADLFPTNHLILHFLKGTSQDIAETCAIHSSFKDRVCVDCCLLICGECEEGKHGKHWVWLREEVKAETERKNKFLQENIEELSKILATFEDDAEVTRESLIKCTKEAFGELRRKIEKEEEICQRITDTFDKIRKEKYKRMKFQKERFEDQLQDLTGNVTVRFVRAWKKPVETLEKKISVLIPTMQGEVLEVFHTSMNLVTQNLQFTSLWDNIL